MSNPLNNVKYYLFPYLNYLTNSKLWAASIFKSSFIDFKVISLGSLSSNTVIFSKFIVLLPKAKSFKNCKCLLWVNLSAAFIKILLRFLMISQLLLF